MSKNADQVNCILAVATQNGMTISQACASIFKSRRNHPVITETECRDITKMHRFRQSEVWASFRPVPGQTEDPE